MFKQIKYWLLRDYKLIKYRLLRWLIQDYTKDISDMGYLYSIIRNEVDTVLPWQEICPRKVDTVLREAFEHSQYAPRFQDEVK